MGLQGTQGHLQSSRPRSSNAQSSTKPQLRDGRAVVAETHCDAEPPVAAPDAFCSVFPSDRPTGMARLTFSSCPESRSLSWGLLFQNNAIPGGLWPCKQGSSVQKKASTPPAARLHPARQLWATNSSSISDTTYVCASSETNPAASRVIQEAP